MSHFLEPGKQETQRAGVGTRGRRERGATSRSHRELWRDVRDTEAPRNPQVTHVDRYGVNPRPDGPRQLFVPDAKTEATCADLKKAQSPVRIVHKIELDECLLRGPRLVARMSAFGGIREAGITR